MISARIYFVFFSALLLTALPEKIIAQVTSGNSPDTAQSASDVKYPVAGSGNLRAGYYYGLTPFISSPDGPMGYFQGDLNMQVNIKTLPFNVSGYYTSLHNVTGLNNSIRVSFDSQAYKQRLENKAHISTQHLTEYLKDSLTKLNNVRQKYTQRLYYLKYLQTLSPEQYQHQLQQGKDKLPASGKDSLASLEQTKADSLKAMNPHFTKPQFSLPQLKLPSGDNYKDSLNDLVNQQKSKVDSLNSLAKTIGQKINSADSLIHHPVPVPSLPGNKFFASVQSLQIGMCYPSLSPFLLSGIPLRGFSIELERKGYYFAAAAGKTISNMLFTPDLIQNNLNNVRNLYNFFDFNKVESGRNIVAIKTGRGSKNGNHIFVGLLYGRGLESYWQDSLNPLNTQQQERNWVAELDGRFDISKNHSLTFNYAKSVIKPINDNPELPQTRNLNWLDYHYRSNALQTKYTGNFPKLKSSLTASVRWVDPYFRSFGAGFVRQDNIRYEIKTEHQLGKKIRLGFNVKRDANNLLHLYDQYTVLQSAGVNVSWKITSRLQIRAMYNPVFQQVKQNGEVIYTNNNQITNTSLSWRPRTGKWQTMITSLYSYYKLFDGTANREYSNLIFGCTTQSKKGLRFNAQMAMYTVTPSDSLLSNSLIYSFDAGYRWKSGLQLLAQIRYAQTTLYGDHPGMGLQIQIPLWKKMALNIEGQRLIPGDFYNSYSIEQFNKFPYFCSTQLVMNW